jgi:hypothetical protein
MAECPVLTLMNKNHSRQNAVTGIVLWMDRPPRSSTIFCDYKNIFDFRLAPEHEEMRVVEGRNGEYLGEWS